jgi:hypothetical protein
MARISKPGLCVWSPRHRFSWVILIALGTCPPCFSQRPSDQNELLPVLQQAREYCRRLEVSALDFVCLEEIKEKTFSSDTAWQGPATGRSLGAPRSGFSLPSDAVNSTVRSWEFDYQYFRRTGTFEERRTLIKEDGKARREENARPPRAAARSENPLFGPVGILGEDWQHRFNFRISGEDDIKGVRAVAVEASPKPPFGEPHPYGRVWIGPADGSVLKIEWNPESIGNIDRVKAIAEILKCEPRLTSFTEYGLVKNGLRFPSRDVTEEAYVDAKGKKTVRSVTTVIYKDYKFFTVETETN